MKEKVEAKLNEFDTFTREHSHFGAYDADTQFKLEEALVHTVHSPNESYKGPETVDDWGMPDDMEGVEEVVSEMTSLARELCGLIRITPIGDMDGVVAVIREWSGSDAI